MDLNKTQNLINECIMIEQGNYLGGNFGVDLLEVQKELDEVKLRLNGVSGTFKEKLIENFDKWMKDENIEKQELYLYGDTYYSFEEIFNTYKSNLDIKP